MSETKKTTDATTPIEPVTEAELADALRPPAPEAWRFAEVLTGFPDGWARVVFLDPDDEPVPVQCGSDEAAAIARGAAALALLPRMAAEVARLRAPTHYAAVGHLCGAWERGARSTSDHAFVTCGDCREHLHHDDPEQGIRQTRFGEECPKCWEKLPPCDDGDVVRCPECKTEFLRADGLPALFPMEPEAADVDP